MEDSTLFYLGIFATVLFLAGILFTIHEFKTMVEDIKKDRD